MQKLQNGHLNIYDRKCPNNISCKLLSNTWNVLMPLFKHTCIRFVFVKTTCLPIKKDMHTYGNNYIVVYLVETQ